jgi:hypothetical protein
MAPWRSRGARTFGITSSMRFPDRLRAGVLTIRRQSVLLPLLWNGGRGATLGGMLAAGALVASTYSVLNLLLNGVILDEGVMSAQIISGSVHYPRGHPHEIYYTKVFNLPNYLAAGLWEIVPDVLLLSGVRNFSFLFLTVFVPFGWAVLLTRQPKWGYISATLTAAGIAVAPFQGLYPISVFPHFYSSGHIGLQTALVVVLLLCAGFARLGGLLLGLVPGIHGVYGAVVWLWAALEFLLRKAPRGPRAREFTIAVAIGTLICALLWGLIQLTTSDAPAGPPYDVTGGGDVIYAQFTSTTDDHRQPFSLRTGAYLLNPAAFFLLAGWLWWRTRRRLEPTTSCLCNTLRSILVLGGVVWMYVYATWVVQKLGGTLPQFIQISMPGRLSNVTAALLLPLTIAAYALIHRDLSETQRSASQALVLAIVAVALAATLVPGRLINEVIFMLWGSLLATAAFAVRPAVGRAAVIGGAALAGMILLVQGKPLFLVTLALSAAILGLASREPVGPRQFLRSRWLTAATIVACVLTSAASLADRQGLRITEEDRELAAWLREHVEERDMILAPFGVLTGLQMRTGRPVLMEFETPWIMSYMPDLAPVIGMMAKDLYGVDYSDPHTLAEFQPRDCSELWVKLCKDAFLDAWRRRSRLDWERLGTKYGFEFVYSPAEMPLNLPVAHSGSSGWTLYRIPRPPRDLPH